MEIKAKVLGFRKGQTKTGKDSFEGYFEIYDQDVKNIYFCDPDQIIGVPTLTVKAWGNDAFTFYNTLFDQKLLDKDVKLVGSMINFNFNCCLISKV